MAKKNQNASTTVKSGAAYWLDQDFNDRVASKVDVIKLASYKRAVGNFVHIVTGRNDIQVKYAVSGRSSYTDGKTVILSARFNTINDFDVAVGLSLHEGSHCLLSDFGVLREIKYFRPWIDVSGKELTAFLKEQTIKRKIYEAYLGQFNDWRSDSSDTTGPVGKFEGTPRQSELTYRKSVLAFLDQQIQIFKNILNIVEDRRIDRYVIDVAPGYQPYYTALYNEYFNNRNITKAFDSKILRSVNWDSYIFCLTNIMNPKFKTDILPKLDEIVEIFDLPNINRLQSTNDSIEVASKIFAVIANIIPMPNFTVQSDESNHSKDVETVNAVDKDPENSNSDSKTENSAENNDIDEEDGKSNVDGSSNEHDDESNEHAGESNEYDGDANDDDIDEDEEDGKSLTSKSFDTDREIDKDTFKRILEKQIQYADGNVKKSKVSKHDHSLIEAAHELDSEYVELKDLNGGSRTYISNINVLVSHGLSESIIASRLFEYHISSYSSENRNEAINKGVSLGTMLGKRLKTRDEDRSLMTTRLESGKIDRRLISELGFNNERIFQNIVHSVSKPSVIHISIDASGSMNGSKWYNSLTASIAIAKAATMVQSMDCVISLRGNYDKDTPLIWVVYDSRKDKFQKFRSLAKYLTCDASTPEGLCFEAIQNEIISTSKGKESFFINLSDGEPLFCTNRLNYKGEMAIEHTKKQIEKFRASGITCLSYYIYDGAIKERPKQNFKRMYGSSAVTVNVTNLIDLTKTINSMFERKIS